MCGCLLWASNWGPSLQPRPVGVDAAAGKTPSLTGELLGETHTGLERTQTHPSRNQHQKGPI